MRGARIASFVGSLALALTPLLPRGAPAAHAEPAERPRILITLAGAPADLAAMEALVREMLGGRDLDLELVRATAIEPREVVVPPDPIPDHAARVWIDLVPPGTTRVYFADARWERVLVRNVPTPQGKDAVAREQVAQIVVGAIDALLAGGQIGIARTEAAESLGLPPSPSPSPGPSPSPSPRPLPPPFPPSPHLRTPSSRSTAALAVGYEAFGWSPRRVSHGLGAAASIATSRAFGPFASFAAIFRIPIVVDRDPVGLRFDVGSFRALAGADVALAPTLRLRLGLGGGIDLVRTEPRARSAGAVAAPARTSVAPIARLSVVFDVRLWSTASIFASFVGDVDLAPRTYVLVEDGRDRTVVEPFRVRPGLTLGLASRIF